MKTFVIACVITATSAMAFAAPHEGHGHRGDRAAHMQKFAEKLGLSDAQKQRIADIRKADRERNQQLYMDARVMRQEYRQLKQANDPRAEEVKTQLQAMRPQLKSARREAHEQFLSVLTPEQRAQLEQLRAQRKQRG